MISTGFQELDDVISGLKKGRLYGLATLNCDRIGAEYFALDMIDNIRRSAFFHPTVDCSYLMTYAEAHYQFKPLFFNQNPNENAEDVVRNLSLCIGIPPLNSQYLILTR